MLAIILTMVLFLGSILGLGQAYCQTPSQDTALKPLEQKQAPANGPLDLSIRLSTENNKIQAPTALPNYPKPTKSSPKEPLGHHQGENIHPGQGTSLYDNSFA